MEQYIKEYVDVHKTWNNLYQVIRNYEYKLFKKYVKDFSSVVEIGLGDGVVTSKLVQDFENVIAIDFDSSVIDTLKINLTGNNLNLMCASIDDCLSIPAMNSVKNVFLGHVLEHLPNPVESLKKLVASINNKNTVYYVSVPNAKSLHRYIGVNMGQLPSIYTLTKQDEQLGHYRWYDSQSLREDLENAGLSISHSGGILIKSMTNGQIEKYLTFEMLEGSLLASEIIPEFCGEIYCLAQAK